MEHIKKLDLNLDLYWHEEKGYFKIIDSLNETGITLSCDAIETLGYQSVHIATIIDLWREKIENSLG